MPISGHFLSSTQIKQVIHLLLIKVMYQVSKIILEQTIIHMITVEIQARKWCYSGYSISCRCDGAIVLLVYDLPQCIILHTKACFMY